MRAKILASTVDMDHEKWLEYRHKGIGGSDAAAIAGLNPYKSAMSVYMEKIGILQGDKDNERMRIGRDLEDYVAKRFSEATGLKVRRKNAILQHPKYEFMLANVDRLIVGKNEGLECKTTEVYSGEEWNNEIPPWYELQCYHYMAVTGAEAWWIAVLIGLGKFSYKKIERDETIINSLIKVEKEFWINNVLSHQVPEPDGSNDADALLKEIYPRSSYGTQIELNGFSDKVERLKKIIQQINHLTKEKKRIEQEIKSRMGENEVAIVGDRKVIWKSYTANRFDIKNFKKDYPQIYKRYLNTKSYRRFQIK